MENSFFVLGQLYHNFLILTLIVSAFSAEEGGDVITMFRFTTTTTPRRTFSTPNGGECTASRPYTN